MDIPPPGGMFHRCVAQSPGLRRYAKEWQAVGREASEGFPSVGREAWRPCPVGRRTLETGDMPPAGHSTDDQQGVTAGRCHAELSVPMD